MILSDIDVVANNPTNGLPSVYLPFTLSYSVDDGGEGKFLQL